MLGRKGKETARPVESAFSSFLFSSWRIEIYLQMRARLTLASDRAESGEDRAGRGKLGIRSVPTLRPGLEQVKLAFRIDKQKIKQIVPRRAFPSRAARSTAP